MIVMHLCLEIRICILYKTQIQFLKPVSRLQKTNAFHIYILQNTDLYFKTQIRFTAGVTVDTKILHLCFEKQIRI